MKNKTKVGYGYNVLNTSYIEPAGTEERYPILDLPPNTVKTDSDIRTEILVATGSSLSELSTDFNEVIGVKGKYELFSASVDVNYRKNTQTNKSYAYTKLMGLHRKVKHVLTNGDEYRQYFTPQFKMDLEGNHALGAIEFFKRYGTHLITEISYGGRFEIDFTTEITKEESVENIKMDIKAAYNDLISANSTTEYTEKTKNIIKRSALSFKCIGGDGTVITSLNGLNKKYDTWLKSLNSEENQEICDIPNRRNLENSLIPIWKLCSSTQRANELEKVFQKLYKELNNGGKNMKTHLSKFDYMVDAKGKKINLNNDMVTAVTQYSVNEAMKAYLENTPTEMCAFTLYTTDESDRSVYFQLFHNTDTHTMPAAFPETIRQEKELYTKLTKLGLFDIPVEKDARTVQQKENIKKAYEDYYLVSGYRFVSGVPSSYKEDQKLAFRPLDLNPSSDPTTAGVLYTQSFKDFQIIELNENHRKLTFSKISQANFEEPWIYRYSIKFSLNDVEFTNLPSHVQEQVRNHFHLKDSEIATLFEMAQLKLDLLTLAVSTQPQIEGIKEETQANLKVVLDRYIKQDMADAFIIGHVVTPRDNTKDYFFRPRRYTFSVSDAIEYNGVKDPDLKTLNYVISFEDADPIPQSYNWEWIKPECKLVNAGVMAIKRDQIFNRFNEDFRTSVLRKLRKILTATMEGNHKTIFDLRWVYGIKEDTSQDANRFIFNPARNLYEYVSYNGEGKKVEGIDNYSHAGEISFYIPPMVAGTADFALRYTMKSTAQWSGIIKDGRKYPAIVFTVDVVAWADVVYDSGHSQGTVYDHTIKCSVGLDVDAMGNITLVKTVEDIPHKETMDKNGWAEFASFGGIDEVIDSISGTVKGWVNEAVDNFKDRFQKNFKHNVAWIMPGQKTFSFDDACFSEYGDFCVKVTYQTK